MANGVRQTDANAVVQTDANGVVQTFIDSQFDVTITSAGTAAPGENLDVTADVTNSGTDSDTQDVTLDIDNSVGEVDSQSVTLSAGQSSTETLTWSVPSGQTEQDYTATVASNDDNASQTVTVSSGPTEITFGFESGDTSRWDTSPHLSASSGSPPFNSGSQIGESDADTSGPLARVTPATIAGGAQISEFEYYWRERSSQFGAGIRLFNSNGDVELGVATDNPEWNVSDANGHNQVNSGGGDDYDDWIRFTLTFDWTAGTFAFDFENLDTGRQETQTGRPLKQGVDVEEVVLEQHNEQTFREGGPVNTDWDDIRVRGGQRGLLISNISSIFAAPGENLDVSVDVTNSTQSQTTQTVTLDIDGVQKDSQSVTLSAGQSSTETLTWSVPSGQTKQDYTATVASDDDSAQTTVTVSSATSAVVQYDASQKVGLSDGDNVTTLADRVGSTDITGNATYKTNVQNGKAVYRFDGVDDGFDGSFSLSQPFTILAVVVDAAQVAGDDNPDREMIVTNDVAGGSGGELGLYWEGNNNHNWRLRANKSGDQFNNLGGTNSSAPILLGGILNGSSSEFREDGGTQATGDTTGAAFDNSAITVGLKNDSISNFLNGDLGELVIYDADLSNTGDLSSEEQRLSDKWGISI